MYAGSPVSFMVVAWVEARRATRSTAWPVSRRALARVCLILAKIVGPGIV